MQIWVDADACPAVIKEILFRAADRTQITLTLVANSLLRTPPSRFIKFIQVPAGFDVADKKIAELAQMGDLVITGDIPLAADVVAQGCFALNPRGEFYTQENIQEFLSIRNFMDELRGSGVNTGGPASMAQSDRQIFANQLDRFLSKIKPSYNDVTA